VTRSSDVTFGAWSPGTAHNPHAAEIIARPGNCPPSAI
jgi:hypothetical protein